MPPSQAIGDHKTRVAAANIAASESCRKSLFNAVTVSESHLLRKVLILRTAHMNDGVCNFNEDNLADFLPYTGFKVQGSSSWLRLESLDR